MRLNTHLALAPPPRRTTQGESVAEPGATGSAVHLGREPVRVSPDPILDVVAEILDRASLALVELAVKLHEAGELARKTEEGT